MSDTQVANVELGSIIGKIGETIQNEANVKAVFGAPIQLETRSLVPVALVSVTLGGGGGGARIFGKGDAPSAAPFGGGGGMTITAVPVGFLSEKDGVVVFTAIDVRTPQGEDIPENLMTRLLHKVQQAAG